MTDDEEAEAPSFSEDERVTFVGNRLCQSFKMKVDKWDKYITVDENQKALADFFEKDTNEFLVFNITPAGLLISSQEVPANLKNKSVYMIKKSADIIILSDNYKKDLLFGEVSVTLLGQMTDVLEKVLLPVLSNKKNNQKWPHFISQDVNRHVENLKSKVSVVKGQVIGRTVLPIPTITDRIRDVQEDCIKQDHYDRTVVHAIESMVISWTHQIRDVLKEDSAQPLLQGLNPGPRTELDFWKARLENMLSIYEQLQSPVVRKIAKILETSESSYYPTFKETFRDVADGLVEAQDVELHLRPLHRYVDLLLEEEFPQTQTLIPPLFHTICLIWTHSKFYSFPARIVVLLQEFCNVLIDQAIIYLSPEELLKGETEETLEHVQVTVNLFKAFKEAFACHRDRLSSFVPDGMEFKPWDFHSQMVFARFDRFLARLLEVEDLFVNILEFQKLEKLEFGGIKGKVLSEQVSMMNDEFLECCKVFKDRNYDPLDYNCQEFEYDYHVFKEKILDLDRRLATILYLAFKDCSGLESAFKLVAVFGCFLERPVVKEIFSPNYGVLLQMFNLELDRCKQLYDTCVQMEKGVKVVNKNMPATSGSLQWAKELKERIQTPWSNFKFIHHPSVEGAEVGVVYQKYLEMLTLLDEYEEQIYSGWTCGVDEVCQFNLDQPLIKRESHSGLLFVNFDPKLVGVLREVKYLHMLNMTSIPEAALTISEQRDMLVKELPEKWNNTKKIAVSVKHEVAPLQSAEVAYIRRKCVAFDVKQCEFREKFRLEAPFNFNADNPYALLEKAHREIKLLEEQMIEMQESSNLFEVTVPDYRQLKQCRREIVILKGLWDIIIYVQSSIEDWTKTQWRQINVEQMDVELRRFAKEIRMLDKEVRGWDAYTGLDSTVKNLVTSLRAVTELQNSAIRERHWHQLMSTTGVNFTMNDDTTLTDLLALQLHRVEDEVRNIVDKAVKEMGIEKVLTEINQTWSTMEFSYEEHYRTRAPLLKSDEELIETLEDNQVQLQAILQSKYVEYFIEQVSSLQKKLTVADSVIFIWMEVQRTWSHLESIFIGSEDIRKQLPQDAKRFDGIDADFKELMFESAKTKNVIEATNKPNLFERLEDLQKRLSLCEKSLAEYLETKRLAFPRFYFVSSADLLDILSKGTQPKEVTRHLAKLFDNMADLKFEEDEKEPTKTAVGMYSKENEYASFSANCNCSGQVETWLSRLEETMCKTVRHHITEAVGAYEEKPREQWLFDYPAQVALTSSQVWWTTDVGIAFERLEEGFETALKDYNKKQISQLNILINMLLGELTPGDRQKIMTICTIDVHARDVVAKLIAQKVTNSQAFPWLSQLRHRWDEDRKHCFANICDAQFQYSYEYLGNTPRLVITPLTDRCYITLTQSLHLTMSGAPAGPAGTGKTETTKDLGRALGVMVYVFNCSEQMDYKVVQLEELLAVRHSVFVVGNAGTGKSETLCSLLDCLLTPENVLPDSPRELYEVYFSFACIWAFGGAVYQDQLIDYRAEFSQWWTKEMKTVKFPSQGTVFDYYLDPQTRKFLHWNDKVPAFVMEPEASLQAVLVHTSETTRLRYFMDLLLERGKPVMLAGNAGVGKTALVGDRMGGLSEEYMVSNVPLNYYTTSAVLQKVLEKPLEKKAGRNYGPPGNKKLIYFIDDLNMPAVDAYGTVQAHTLIRQHMDYKHRHFTVFAVNFPSADALEAIYSQILNFHFQQFAFNPAVVRTGSTVVQAAIWLHQKMVQNFLPTAIKFHYIFNLRDLSNIFQGILFSAPDCLKQTADLVQLWLHESSRVYADKLVESKDSELFHKMLLDTAHKYFEYSIASTVVGEIPDLFSDEEVDGIITGIRNEVRGLGLLDSRENCWKFFIERVRQQLKVVLCFSPVGSTLRIRARKFPAVVNCTAIDWFHEWPQEALQSVSRRLIEEIQGIEPSVQESISLFMAYVHTSVNETSEKYRQNEKRYNYTTPKNFLEQIALYKNLLGRKRQELSQKMERLANGIEKLKTTASQVEDLKAKLASQEVELNLKNQDAEALITKIGLQTEKVSHEKTIADAEEQKVAAIQAEVSAKQKDCEDDLSKAEPALVAATTALNTLNKVNLTELKTFPNPPIAVTNVSAAVMALMAPRGKVPKDRSWKAAKIFMGKVDDFLQALIHYDKEHIPENCLKVVKEEYLKNPEFHPDLVRTKSFAASGLCAWVINIIRYYEVFCDVEPKRQALSQANTDLDTATGKLETIRKKLVLAKWQIVAHAQIYTVTVLHIFLLGDANLRRLTTRFEKATAEKVRCQDEVTRTNRTIELANRLVKGLEVPIPLTEGLDPIGMLTDDATVAAWNNEGLPSDRMSTENATILTNCERWPLMIDPQQQGIKWIKNKYGSDLKVVCLGQKGYLDTIERAVAGGETVLIENLEETVEPVLDTLLGRNTIKKGRYIRIGDKECEYSSRFRLILHTKLANPHYKPEMQAQSTLINFTVTRDGLEEQLLAEVVSTERPDLEKLKSELTKQQNDFKIELKRLEDELLTRLSAAKGSFLGDTVLVEKLETTKLTAAEIECKVFEAKENEIKINEAREFYRPAAERASVLYFIINDLSKINPMYQFSLKTFNIVFHKAIERAEKCDEVQERVVSLKDCITYSVFLYTSRGLFERDKLTFLSQTAFQILLINKAIDPQELDFLLRFNIELSSKSPVHFLSSQAWSAIKTMSMWDGFRGLDRDIEGSAKRWKKLVESECPEREKFPQEWKNKSSLQKLIMLRALRPDRMTYAVRNYVEENIGSKYVEGARMEFAKSYEESSPATPVFFILSAGVNPLKDVESLGKKLGFTIDLGKLHNVSLGQGQEVVAEKALEKASHEGHWVILQNVHLVAKWLGTLEKLLEKYSEGSHPDYRVFISAEPAATPDEHSIPQGILENSIKITNEPPTGMLANLHAALYNFDQDTLEMCAREQEFKSILFCLCYFHACVAERRKFGPQGWNRSYPFNTGDLTISVNVLYNYLEANTKVPWEDLCYLFGEIMYGGHITDDWDRRLCHTYLEEFMHPDMLEGELFLAPGFVAPPNLDYVGYHKYVDDVLPPESPVLYGLHPNAEIEFLTVISDNLFRTILEMQPRDLAIGEGSVQTAEEKVKNVLDDILEKLPEKFNMHEIMLKTSERTPYIVVCFQECERMNLLIHEIRRSLKELDLGLKGELTISSEMEALQSALYYDTVPGSWTKLAYPSTYGLGQWINDLLLRCRELDTWTQDLVLPAVVWLSGFFNPQSFLTSIMQSMARKNEWPLDKMCLTVDVTKKTKDDYGHPPREGAYIHGLYMEGARWDAQCGITEAWLKDLTPAMPVIYVRAIPVDRQETKSIYACPVYKTKTRGPTHVWTFNLKTKEKPARWILAGVALLLSV
ncbi:Dynein heavy chain 11, axonemal [Acipenser ruthenus]|uniref:Dynein heavy chain 11, axonemal n=1 Tax=Acipenser ruthenus TaxID=7906 RepID=A0A444UAQ1_ACIRT|nr:Dynein heavy chain 11, axonemal [Acipenser ruthenus]